MAIPTGRKRAWDFPFRKFPLTSITDERATEGEKKGEEDEETVLYTSVDDTNDSILISEGGDGAAPRRPSDGTALFYQRLREFQHQSAVN